MKTTTRRAVFEGVELKELVIDRIKGGMEARFALISSKEGGMTGGKSTFPGEHWMRSRTQKKLAELLEMMEEDALIKLFPDGEHGKEETHEPEDRPRGLVGEAEDPTSL